MGGLKHRQISSIHICQKMVATRLKNISEITKIEVSPTSQGYTRFKIYATTLSQLLNSNTRIITIPVCLTRMYTRSISKQ